MLPANYDITQDTAFTTWVARRQGRLGGTSDVRGPTKCLKRWCSFLGMTLSEALVLRREHLASTAEETRNWEEAKLEEFMAQIAKLPGSIKEGNTTRVARGTVKYHWAAVHSFYTYLKVPLTDKVPKSWTETEYHPLTIPDVREVYNFADTRAKLVLGILTGTGLGNEDLGSINLGPGGSLMQGAPTILEQLSTGKDYIILKMLRSKTKVRFRSILAPAVVADLRDYIQYRKSKGETISPDSPLLTGEQAGDVDRKDVYRIIQVPANAAGKDWLTPKLIRKLFNQIVKNKGFDDHAEYWMGHKMSQERRAYFENMPDAALLEAYKKVEKDLAVAPEAGEVDKQQMELKIKLDILKLSMPDLYTAFIDMQNKLGENGRALSAKDALQWIAGEGMKRQPSGGLAWTQRSKRDKLRDVLSMLGEVLSEGTE